MGMSEDKVSEERKQVSQYVNDCAPINDGEV